MGQPTELHCLRGFLIETYAPLGCASVQRKRLIAPFIIVSRRKMMARHSGSAKLMGALESFGPKDEVFKRVLCAAPITMPGLTEPDLPRAVPPSGARSLQESA